MAEQKTPKNNFDYGKYVDITRDKDVKTIIDYAKGTPYMTHHSTNHDGDETTTVWLVDGMDTNNPQWSTSEDEPSWAAVCVTDEACKETRLYLTRIDEETAQRMREDMMTHGTLTVDKADKDEKTAWFERMDEINGHGQDGRLRRIGIGPMPNEKEALETVIQIVHDNVNLSEVLPKEECDKINDTLYGTTRRARHDMQIHVMQRTDDYPTTDIVVLAKTEGIWDDNDSWNILHSKGYADPLDIEVTAEMLLAEQKRYKTQSMHVNMTLNTILQTAPLAEFQTDDTSFHTAEEALAAVASKLCYPSERTKTFVADMQAAGANVQTYGTDVVASEYLTDSNGTRAMLVDTKTNGSYLVASNDDGTSRVAPLAPALATKIRHQMLESGTLSTETDSKACAKRLRDAGLPENLSNLHGVTVTGSVNDVSKNFVANIANDKIPDIPEGIIAVEHSGVVLKKDRMTNTFMQTYLALETTDGQSGGRAWAVALRGTGGDLYGTGNNTEYATIQIDDTIAEQMSRQIAEHGPASVNVLNQWSVDLLIKASEALYNDDMWKTMQENGHPCKDVIGTARSLNKKLEGIEWTKAGTMQTATSMAFAETIPDINVPSIDELSKNQPENEHTLKV